MQPEIFAETMDGETVEWMKQIASNKKIILTGSLMIKEDEQYFNRLIWMLPNGDFGCYDKRHLFAYGDENNHYSAGKKRCIASVKGWKNKFAGLLRSALSLFGQGKLPFP